MTDDEGKKMFLAVQHVVEMMLAVGGKPMSTFLLAAAIPEAAFAAVLSEAAFAALPQGLGDSGVLLRPLCACATHRSASLIQLCQGMQAVTAGGAALVEGDEAEVRIYIALGPGRYLRALAPLLPEGVGFWEKEYVTTPPHPDLNQLFLHLN